MASMDPGDRAAERAQICEALIDLVADRGFRAVKLDQVLRRAEVEHSDFNRHFEGLDECFAAAWMNVDDELGGRMRSGFEAGGGWPDGLRQALRAGLDYMAAEEDRARLYVDEAVYASPELRARQQLAITRLSSMIDPGREAPGDDGSVRHTADAVCGAIWTRVKQLLYSGRGTELPAELPQFMYFAVLPYRGKVAAEAELARPM